jgi:hypothetical protein
MSLRTTHTFVELPISKDDDSEQFDRELLATRPPQFTMTAFPLRMVL